MMNIINNNRFDVVTRLESLLAEKGWSRYRLAKESGIPHSTLANLWRRANAPTIVTLEDICRALGIRIFHLAGRRALRAYPGATDVAFELGHAHSRAARRLPDADAGLLRKRG